MPTRRARTHAIRRLALVVLVVLAGACASEESRHAQHLESAERYLAEDKQAEALIELRSALKIRPQDPETNFRIARVLEQRGSVLDAVFFYRETSRLDPERSDALLQEAKLVLQDDPERAEAILKDMLERSPEEPLVHVRAAELALVRADIEKALAAALTATQVAPRFSQGFHQLGIVHEARIRQRHFEGQEPGGELYQAAIDAFRRADGLAEGSVEARVEIARLYTVWPGHEREAAQAFREALASAQEAGRTPNIVQIGYAAAKAGELSGDEALRKDSLRAVIEARPGALRAWGELARLADDETQGSGEAVYQELLGKRPEDPQAHLAWAEYLLRQGRRDEGLAHLDQAVAQGVPEGAILTAKLRLQERLGLREDAKQTLEQLKSQRPDDPGTRLAVARDAVNGGRLQEGAEALRKLTEDHESYAAFSLLALAELRLGNLAAAAAAADRTLDLAPPRRRSNALRLKTNVAFLAGDCPSVVQLHQQLAQTDYEFRPIDMVWRSHCLYELGRADGGRRLLEQVLALPDWPVGAAVEWDTREGAKDPERAYQLLVAAYEKNPIDAVLLRKLVQKDVARGQTGQALQRVNQALTSGRAGANVLLLRAELLAGTGDLPQAERDALRAFETNPKLPGAIEILVGLYSAQNKLGEAVESFAEAEQAGVLDASARVLLGRLYLTAGDGAKARAMYEKALAERSDLPEAKNDLAYLLAKDDQDLDRALRLAQEAQQALDREPSTADTVGYVYYRKGLHEAAVQQFRHALELAESSQRPAPPEVHYHLGLALRALGREPEAAAAFEEVLRLDANFGEAEAVRRELEAARAASAASAGAS